MNAEEYRTYQLADGWEILVGKTAAANDRLSLKIGRPNDFWFHVAGMPGSHVLARHGENSETLPREVKRIAAGLAAFFSKAKNGGRTSVHFTTCKHVSKRKGAPPGQVVLKKFDAIQVAPLDPNDIFGE